MDSFQRSWKFRCNGPPPFGANPNKGIFIIKCDLSNYPKAIVLIKVLTGKTLIAKELNTNN